MNNLLDDEGKGWFEENKEQQRRFTEQQIHEVLIKENLQEGQTFQEEGWRWQADRDEEMAQKRESEAMAKEDGIVDMFKKM
jgi:DNA topoisomerase VI subunit A